MSALTNKMPILPTDILKGLALVKPIHGTWRDVSSVGQKAPSVKTRVPPTPTRASLGAILGLLGGMLLPQSAQAPVPSSRDVPAQHREFQKQTKPYPVPGGPSGLEVEFTEEA